MSAVVKFFCVAVMMVAAAVERAESGEPISPAIENAEDALISEYEEFVYEYIAIMQRVVCDASAVADAEAIGPKAEEWTKHWEDFDLSRLTTNQIQRLTEISKMFAVAKVAN